AVAHLQVSLQPSRKSNCQTGPGNTDTSFCFITPRVCCWGASSARCGVLRNGTGESAHGSPTTDFCVLYLSVWACALFWKKLRCGMKRSVKKHAMNAPLLR